jgi:glycosyltransferase involved in cell wall biosynthesis
VLRVTAQPRSFHETDRSAVEKGRLFLFSYHFPPDTVAGALRWQKLAVHAAARGWGLDVLTRDPADLERSDPSRLRELPPGVRVYGIRQPLLAAQRLERWLWGPARRRRARRAAAAASSPGAPAAASARPAALKSSFARDELRFEPFSRRSWVRSYHGWELYTAHRAWARDAARVARALFDPASHRIAVSCGPPHGAHEGARLLARATGIPFAIDMRDPWSGLERWNESVASPTTPWIASRHERRTVAEAALVVANTEPARAAMQSLHPAAADRIIAVLNGYDEDDALPRAPRDGVFRLAYAGAIYLDRNPTTLFQAAARLVREQDLRPGQLSIEFMGPPAQLDGDTIGDLARRCGIEAFVTVRGEGTRREAAEFLARASVLVNLPQDSHLAIPSKIFEYMRFEAWLLALADAGSATEAVLQGSGADVAAPGDVDRITALLRARYLQYRAGETPRPLALDGRWSRAAQAQRLFDAIDRVLAHRPVAIGPT